MKGKGWSTAVALLMLITGMSLTMGCGQKTVATRQGGMGLFTQATQTIKNINSFRITGNMDMSISMSGMGADLPVDMSVPMEEEIEQGDGYFKMKAVVGISSNFGDSGLNGSGSGDITMYLIDDRLYYESQGKWYYSQYSTPLTAMGGGNNQLITPQSILQMMEYADSVVIVEETDSQVRYHLVLGDKYYQQALDEFKKIMPNYPVDQYESLIKGMKYELEVTVDKASEQAVHLQVVMVGDNLEYMQDIKMSMRVKGEFDFSDYGEDFNIQLPAEAANAQYVDTSAANPF
jgi:hypothetical protein